MRKLSQRGFSITEVIVSITLLLVASCSAIASIVSCIVMTTASSNLSIAVTDAQHVLEQIKTLSYAEIAAYTPPTLSNLPGESVVVTRSGGVSITEVTVQVNWQEFQNARSFSLSTRIAS